MFRIGWSDLWGDVLYTVTSWWEIGLEAVNQVGESTKDILIFLMPNWTPSNVDYAYVTVTGTPDFPIVVVAGGALIGVIVFIFLFYTDNFLFASREKE